MITPSKGCDILSFVEFLAHNPQTLVWQGFPRFLVPICRIVNRVDKLSHPFPNLVRTLPLRSEKKIKLPGSLYTSGFPVQNGGKLQGTFRLGTQLAYKIAIKQHFELRNGPQRSHKFLST